MIRRAAAGDAPALAALRWEFKEGPGSGEDRTSFLARCRAYVEESLSEYWIAEADGAIVGVATLRLAAKEPTPGEASDAIGYLTNVYLTPRCRRQGRGTQLLSAVIADARRRPVELLIVWPSEESRSLYRRLGFREESDPMVLDLAEEAP